MEAEIFPTHSRLPTGVTSLSQLGRVSSERKYDRVFNNAIAWFGNLFYADNYRLKGAIALSIIHLAALTLAVLVRLALTSTLLVIGTTSDRSDYLSNSSLDSGKMHTQSVESIKVSGVK